MAPGGADPEAESDPDLEAYYRGLETFARTTNQATQSWAAEDPA